MSALKKILKGWINNNISFTFFKSGLYNTILKYKAGWQSGAAACKAVYAGSIPASASTKFRQKNLS